LGDLNKEVGTPDLSAKSDGTYRGEYTIGPVKVVLDVTMENSRMASISIIKHRNGRGEKAEDILPVVIEQQSLGVDVISGATMSSRTILKAIENALN
jgi:uncharacterized protein with FMN-binding domain